MPLHHIWLAFDEICAGNIAEAGKHLESARGEKLNPNYSFLVTVMQCVVKMAQASFKESDRVFCEIDHLLKHARFTYNGYSLQPARRRIYRKCLEEIAGYRKGAAGSLWHLNRRIKSYLPGIRGTSGSAGSGRENTETGYRPTRTSFGWLWFFMIFILVSQFGRLFNRQNPGNKYVPVLSQYETALNYELGNGVPRDYAMAAEWYRKAAERGHSDAQYTLGTMYESGRGVVGNCATAAAWYQRAAERGHPNAQYRLGLMCESGAAGVKDNILAYMWLSLSIMSNGLNSGDAEKRVREIAESMTPLQKETAQRMTREWKPIE